MGNPEIEGIKKEMSLCYEFEKWTMITFVLVSASLTVGLN